MYNNYMNKKEKLINAFLEFINIMLDELDGYAGSLGKAKNQYEVLDIIKEMEAYTVACGKIRDRFHAKIVKLDK